MFFYGKILLMCFCWVDSEIAAIAKWWFPHSLTPEQAAAEAAADAAPKPEPLPGYNQALCDEFTGQLAANRKKWVVREDMYCTSTSFYLSSPPPFPEPCAKRKKIETRV